MNFNRHYLEGKHAFLSPSKHHWTNYDVDKMLASYNRYEATLRGERLHNLAAELILLGVRMPNDKNSFNMFVNDAIGYKMIPEQPLYYSEYCHGTADAICFRDDLLRIHDLKTGVSKTSMDQLLIYDALFCLEYNFKPNDIQHELRIYQSNKILYHNPEMDEIYPIINTIVEFTKILEDIESD